MRKNSRAGPASIAMASQGEAVCVLEGVVRGHHIYRTIWTSTVGEILVVRQEPGKDHDRHAVCIKRGAEIVGHVPRELSRMVWHFPVHGGQETCVVTGRRQFGPGLEVSCTYKFTGSEKLVNRMQGLLKKAASYFRASFTVLLLLVY